MNIKFHIAVSILISIILIVVIFYRTRANEKSTILETSKNDVVNVNKSSNSQNNISSNVIYKGYNGISYTDNVKLEKSDDSISYIEVIGSKAQKNMVWFNANAISGHVYRLSFKSKSENNGSFAAIRFLTNEDKCIFTKPSNDWMDYSEEFKSFKTRKFVVLFSSNEEGSSFFKDFLLIDMGIE